MNESNISRDHIALEVMKVLLEKSVRYRKSRLSGEFKSDLIYPDEIAKVAYNYADAMIAEREQRIQNQED